MLRVALPLAVLALLLAGLVSACKDAPGADGRYAGSYPRAGPGRWAP